MNDIGALVDVWTAAMSVSAKVGAPFLLTGLAVGLTISLLQAATQVQENILTLVPKLIAVGMVLTMSGSWLLDELSAFTRMAMETSVQIAKEGR